MNESSDVWDGRADLERQPAGERRSSALQQVKSTAVDNLNNAADALRKRSAQAGESESLANFEQKAADWLNRSADYLNDLNADKFKTDVRNQVHEHPGRTLLIAGAAGLLIGTILRRR
jgi:ElaB/YqjD/DUF883 family membrane-anchored ribosome-binding protein